MVTKTIYLTSTVILATLDSIIQNIKQQKEQMNL